MKELPESLHRQAAAQRTCCLDTGQKLISTFVLDAVQVSTAKCILGTEAAVSLCDDLIIFHSGERTVLAVNVPWGSQWSAR